MQWQDLLTGFAFYLILEGLLPFLNPAGFKRFMLEVCQMPEERLRTVGIISMIAGVVLLYLVR
ncbi:MAG: DUF2065 domain-containing protein [Pseudomonadota bacterium]